MSNPALSVPQTASPPDRPSEWAILAETLRERLQVPASRPLVWAYLLFGVLLVGGLGAWLEFAEAWHLGKGTRSLAVSVATYAMAISVTVVGDAILEKDLSRWLKGIVFMVFVGYLLALLKSATWIAGLEARWCLLPGVVVVIAPMVALWWVLAGSDSRYAMLTNPAHALGDDPMQDL